MQIALIKNVLTIHNIFLNVTHILPPFYALLRPQMSINAAILTLGNPKSKNYWKMGYLIRSNRNSRYCYEHTTDLFCSVPKQQEFTSLRYFVSPEEL